MNIIVISVRNDERNFVKDENKEIRERDRERLGTEKLSYQKGDPWIRRGVDMSQIEGLIGRMTMIFSFFLLQLLIIFIFFYFL